MAWKFKRGIYFTPRQYLDVVRSPSKILAWAPLVERKLAVREYMCRAQVQLQLADVCNLACSFCSYKELRSRAVLSLDQIKRALAVFSPRTVILTGGGEPALYREFAEAVRIISESGARLGLITNGTVFPEIDLGLWQAFEWVRISIYPQSSYRSMKLRERALKSISSYLETPVKYTSVGILFDPASGVADLFGQINACKSCLEAGGPAASIRRPAVQIRILREFEMSAAQENGTMARAALAAIIKKEMEKCPGDLRQFLLEATNIYEFLSDEGEGMLVAGERQNCSQRCCISLLDAVVRANGDIYPCDNTPQIAKWRIGNMEDPPEVLAEGTARVFSSANPRYCLPCRYDAMNSMLDRYMEMREMEPFI